MRDAFQNPVANMNLHMLMHVVDELRHLVEHPVAPNAHEMFDLSPRQ